MGGLIGSVGNALTGKGSPSTSNLGGTSGLLGLGQGALAGGDVNLSNQVAGLAPNDVNLAQNVTGLGNTLSGYAGPYLQGGQQQYQAGLAGQLTPAQQALTDYNLNQMNLATAGIYGNLGLGDSTMKTQDQNANDLQSLAQQEAINFQNEQYGMMGSQTGQSMLQGAGSLLGQAGNLYGQAGGLYNTAGGLKGDAGQLLGGQQQGIDQLLKQLYSAAGNAGGIGGAGSGLSSYFTGAPTSAASGALSGGSLNLGATGLGDTAFNFLTGGSNLGADAATAAGTSGAADTLSSFIPDVAAAFS